MGKYTITPKNTYIRPIIMIFTNPLQYLAVLTPMDIVDDLLLEFSLIKSEIEVIKREALKRGCKSN